MKLILCEKCSDVLSLRNQVRRCSCGLSGGSYCDEVNAEVWGPCFVLGFANTSLVEALRAQKYSGDSSEKMLYGYLMVAKGREFKAFVVPDGAPSVKRIEDPDV